MVSKRKKIVTRLHLAVKEKEYSKKADPYHRHCLHSEEELDLDERRNRTLRAPPWRRRRHRSTRQCQ